jgi:hypothetical protein
MAADTSQDKENKLTIRRILGDLEPGQLWIFLGAAATVIGAVISASFWAGQRFPAPQVASASAAAAPIPCYQMPDWPKGRWWTWGHLEHTNRQIHPAKKQVTPLTEQNADNLDQVTSEVVFTSHSSYETQSDEPATDARKRKFTATAQGGELAPGATVFFTGHDATGYATTATLTVTQDGCMLKGTWEDNHGSSGSQHMLYESDQYYVLPK